MSSNERADQADVVYSQRSTPHAGLLRTNLTAFLIMGKKLPRLMASVVIARTAAPVVAGRAGFEMKKHSLRLHTTLVRTTITTNSTILYKVTSKQNVRTTTHTFLTFLGLLARRDLIYSPAVFMTP
jgi:hypothetical protein